MKLKFNILGLWDIVLTKLAVAAFVLFIIAGCKYVSDWVISVNYWYFLIAAIVFAIKPVIGFFKGK